MRKQICLLVALVMAAALMMVTMGCSKQEPEQVETQQTQEETFEELKKAQEETTVAEKVPDQNAKPAEIVMIYALSGTDAGLERHMDDVPEISEGNLSDKLVEYHVLPDEAELMVFDPSRNIICYTGVSELTPRQAVAVLNTLIENLELEGQWELQLDGNVIMTSGFCSDWKTIDDSYEGGADDFDSDISVGGPGVEG